MKLTSQSKKLINFFADNYIQNQKKVNNNVKNIFIKLYNDILDAYEFIKQTKKQKGDRFYSIEFSKIISTKQIFKPKKFNNDSFPQIVRNHIDEMSMAQLTYHFSLFDKKITVHFIVENSNADEYLNNYNKYIDSILMWLFILNKYSSPLCSKSLVIYFYMTSLKKILPESNINVLDEVNVNTAFTYTCNIDAEIVIYRKEEWFKVFIHETFHNFGLDFSDMNNEICNNKILSIFDVESEVNLYEAYTEFWAEIINALFCSFYMLSNKKNMDEFISVGINLIEIEKMHSFFQMVKTLNFMGLNYIDLYSKSQKSQVLRTTMYKEDTNVLAYFIIKTILLNNYEEFLLWCNNNNSSLFQFKKTALNQERFCNFIIKNHRSREILENVIISEDLIKLINQKKKKTNHHDFLLTNMRMTLCELG
jgi:hypothetical protein